MFLKKCVSKYNKPTPTTLDKARQILTRHLHFIGTSQHMPTSKASLKAQRTSAAHLDEVRQTVIGHLGFLGALPTFLRDMQCDGVQQLLKSELAVGRESLISWHLHTGRSNVLCCHHSVSL